MADLAAARTPAPSAWARAAARRLTKQRLRRLLLVLGPALVLIAVAYFYFTGGRYIATEDAYVRAETVNLSTDVSGIVDKVLVHDNETVAAGQPLFQLDDEPFRIALANAEGQLGVVRDDIEALKASYRQKQENIKLAETNVAYYEREFQRKQVLLGQNFASQQAFDQARHDLDTARSQLAQMRQDLAGVVANLNGNPDIPVEQHPRYVAAMSQVDEAKRNLRHTIVRAPMAGIVTNVPSLTPGTYLKASTTGFNLVATDHVWIEADFKETELTHAAPGQHVRVTVDTYPGVSWDGVVESLSPASGGSFSLLPAQNTSGNWVKVVQRIPVRVRVENTPDKPALRAGMSVEVDIDTGHYRRLPHFLAAVAADPSV
ncbi:MAG: HlyD family secretion protein [Alphaproteobacteria bacterium]|nr:HlyD family secretion protein [Alphaproteobacteria bacterium]